VSPENFQDHLLLALNKSAMPVEELAKRCDVGISKVERWIYGRSAPKDKLRRIEVVEIAYDRS
jgi:hypothetical protein